MRLKLPSTEMTVRRCSISLPRKANAYHPQAAGLTLSHNLTGFQNSWQAISALQQNRPPVYTVKSIPGALLRLTLYILGITDM